MGSRRVSAPKQLKAGGGAKGHAPRIQCSDGRRPCLLVPSNQSGPCARRTEKEDHGGKGRDSCMAVVGAKASPVHLG